MPAFAFRKLRQLSALLGNSNRLSPTIYEFVRPEFDCLSEGIGHLFGGDLSGPSWVLCTCKDCQRKAGESDHTALPGRNPLDDARPYEVNRGHTDAVHTRSIGRVERVIERQGVATEQRMKDLVAALTEAREEFHKISVRNFHKRPLIGVVGEIFCRLTSFTNDFTIRKIEEFGGECTLAHIVEWVWYTNLEHKKRLQHSGQMFTKAMLVANIKNHIQHKDEHRLYRVFEEDFRGYEEPPITRLFDYSDPYLPHEGSLGEMTLSVGKAVFHYHQGCDGVVDISPFTCMNGIVTEAIYPKVSADHEDIPIRNFFFDGTQTDLDRDVGIFMELARTYQARKKRPRP
ncbi:MAG: hypothetical protein ABSH28_17185 [Acidobacteriota bacterium]